MTQIIAEKLIHELNKIEEIFHKNEITDNNTLSIRGALLYMKEAIQASIKSEWQIGMTQINAEKLLKELNKLHVSPGTQDYYIVTAIKDSIEPIQQTTRPFKCEHPEWKDKQMCTICGKNFPEMSVTPDEDSWIPFNGYTRPVHPETVVCIHLKNFERFDYAYKKAKNVQWGQIDSYKIIKAYEEPKKEKRYEIEGLCGISTGGIYLIRDKKNHSLLGRFSIKDEAQLICDTLNYWDENHGK